MPVLVRDIETRSTVDLKDVGTHIYAAHPSTSVRCVAYCIDDEPVQVWHPGEPVPKIIRAANGATWVAHNAAFEMAIERNILGPRHGFPVAPIEQQVCTMAQVLALALPGSLAHAAKVLNLEHQKDSTGARVQVQMAKPRRPHKDEDPNGVYFFDDAERHEKSDLSCITDAEITREIYQRLPPLSVRERQVWLLDQRINDRGFYLDRQLAEAANRIAAAAHPYINAELTKITNGEVTAYTQVARIMAWLKEHLDVTTLNKKAIDGLLDLELEEDVRRVLELRLLGAQAAVAKADALLDRCGADGRVRGAFVYHAAGTGRWSSRGAQVHNLKRSLTEDIEHAVEVIGTGDFNFARKEYNNPLSVIGDCIRAMIISAPGHMLIGGDFSGIEARVTAWIAGEQSKLDVFKAFDAGKGPDPYIIAAAKIFKIDPLQLAADYAAGKPEARELRQIGKACELAFGFQGGVNAYRRFQPAAANSTSQAQSMWQLRHGDFNPAHAFGDIEGFTDAEIDKIKRAWRQAHPNIERFWHNIERAAWMAVRDPGSIVSLGNNLQLTCDEQPFLFLTLPGGRKLSYPNARITNAFVRDGKIIEYEYGEPMLLFKDSMAGQWRDVNLYGGFLTENIVQAIARDLMTEAMQRIDKMGFSVVTHVHDECVIEVPTEQVERTKPIFTQLMMQLPEWAEGLPVVAKPWVNNRYTK